MSIQEKISEDNITQEAEEKIDMEKMYSRLEMLNRQIGFSENKEFQDWMLLHVSLPLKEVINAHLRENDTNKSFRGKGEIKIYQRLMTWTHILAKEIAELKDAITKREAELADEEEPNNFRPEN